MERLCQSASQEHSYFRAFRLGTIPSRTQDLDTLVRMCCAHEQLLVCLHVRIQANRPTGCSWYHDSTHPILQASPAPDLTLGHPFWLPEQALPARSEAFEQHFTLLARL